MCAVPAMGAAEAERAAFAVLRDHECRNREKKREEG